MKVQTATLAGGNNNQDRVFVTDNAVVVLDGASAFESVAIDPGLYAEAIGSTIAYCLLCHPCMPIAHAVETAIADTVRKLNLGAGKSPSSTVTVLRTRENSIDLYVLGDSPVYYGAEGVEHAISDERLADLPIAERSEYLKNLRSGKGFGEVHCANLAALQRAQRPYRNVDTGYWIAETEPGASSHALAIELECNAFDWFVLATDGVADLIRYLGRPSWSSIASWPSEQLGALLRQLQSWEQDSDPNGQKLPRAKRHDDKTIATVLFD